MENCYVLFVKTGYEKEIVDRLKSNSQLNPFVPMKEFFYIRNGIAKKEAKVCFKGYVFVESNLNPNEFFYLFTKRTTFTKNIIRILNYGKCLDIAMRIDERLMLSNIFGEGFYLNVSAAILVNNRVKIIAGPLVGMESAINKINLRKKEAMLEIEFMGNRRHLWVGLDVLDLVRN